MFKKILVVLLSLMLLMPCGLAEETADTVKVPVVAEEPACTLERLVHSLAQHLMGQDYTLDILTEYEAQTIRAGSSDGETIQVEINADGEPLGKILIDSEQVTVSSEYDEEAYTYDELLNHALSGMETNAASEQLPALDGMFDEHDLAFLEKAGNLAYYELVNAGVLPVIKRMNGDTYFMLNLSPDLIETAAVRLAESLLDYEAEIDSLLVHLNPLLRSLIPELYEEYDSETGTIVERDAYTCAEIRTLFESWMTDDWLSGYINFEGMHLDVSGFIGNDGWHVDAGFFMPGSEISVWVELDGDEDGRFNGVLECCFDGYSRASERYEMQSVRFDISGEFKGRSASLRVRPETPLNGFTGLRIDYISDYSGLTINAATDILDLSFSLSDGILDLSCVIEELMLDMHLNWFGGVPRGTLIYRDGYDGVYFKLNEAE